MSPWMPRILSRGFCRLSRARGERADVLAALPPDRRLYESFSLFFNTITLAGIGVFTPLGERMSAAGAFGPALFCTREAYKAAGGHRADHGEVMEDLALGRRMRMGGIRSGVFRAAASCRSACIPTSGRAGEGWTKNFSSGLLDASAILLLCVLWVTGGSWRRPVVSFSGGHVRSGSGRMGCGCLSGICAAGRLERTESRSLASGRDPLYPVPLVIFVLVFVLSWIRTGSCAAFHGAADPSICRERGVFLAADSSAGLLEHPAG